MPKCHFCGDDYFGANNAGPAELCDCGASMSRHDARDLSDEAYAERKRFAEDIKRLGYDAAVAARKDDEV